MHAWKDLELSCALHVSALRTRRSLRSLARCARLAMLNVLSHLEHLQPFCTVSRRLKTIFGAYFARLGAISGRFGAYLARLVASLASPGAILRRLGAISGNLGAYLARFDGYLPRLGAILGRLRRILASQKPPKIAPRRLQDCLLYTSPSPRDS